MWFLTAIFQAVAQAVTWVLPVSESGHSAIFHDFSGRFSGNGSELTGLVHIGIALGIFLVFIKLFVRLFGEFIAFFKDAFAKQNPFVNPGGARRFMFGTVLGFLPMVLLLVPAGKYGNVYGLFRSMGYNGTLLDEGVFFALTGGLILLALLQMKKHGPQKNVDWYAALILGFAAAFSLPIAGLSYMGGEAVYWINVLWMLLGQSVVLYAVGVPVYFLAKRNLVKLVYPEGESKKD